MCLSPHVDTGDDLRKILRIEPDTSLSGLCVVPMLEGLRQLRGTPAAILVDKGTDFTSHVVDQWAYQNQVALHFSERGKPTQNAFIESFNGKFRDECLNQNWFVDLQHAREVIEAWRVDYNTVRPHSSLRYLTPEEFAPSVTARSASPPRRSFPSPRRGKVRMCRNPGVLTYRLDKNGGSQISLDSGSEIQISSNANVDRERNNLKMVFCPSHKNQSSQSSGGKHPQHNPHTYRQARVLPQCGTPQESEEGRVFRKPTPVRPSTSPSLYLARNCFSPRKLPVRIS